jgi:hypothetical protein
VAAAQERNMKTDKFLERQKDLAPRNRNRNWEPPKPRPKPATAAGYKIVMVRHAGSIKTYNRSLAPDTTWMLEFGKRNASKFVTRFWPSKKGWRVLDMRNAQNFTTNGAGYPMWVGWRYLPTIFPSEEAAVMAAISLA